MSLDAATSRLSWTIDAKTRGWMQSAFQIQAASSEAILRAGKSDLWDSGRVASNKTLGVRYAGNPIIAGNRVFRAYGAYGAPQFINDRWDAMTRWMDYFRGPQGEWARLDSWQLQTVKSAMAVASTLR